SYYATDISSFMDEDPSRILGLLAQKNEFALEQSQRKAWNFQIANLQENLRGLEGRIYFEFAIPRMGKRVDVVLLIQSVVFVLEYKVGETDYPSHAVDQVIDYALDLKNFHATSHSRVIVPILVASNAPDSEGSIHPEWWKDWVLRPLKTNGVRLGWLIREILAKLYSISSKRPIEVEPGNWEQGSYLPTPTIIEAAMALYGGHSVADISRREAAGEELHRTTDAISRLIARAKAESFKAVCFVTGVPGAGKTLIGLNVATQHMDKESGLYCVFLSGNGPLVKVLQEALARDKVAREKARGRKVSKRVAQSEVKSFIQNVHHYRDECLRDQDNPPADHVALFDEAQRAWNLEQTKSFMHRKKGLPNFNRSEPDFLLSCVDRHPDWGVVVCLVGGGQEINTGEAGISEWIAPLNRTFTNWHVHISNRLQDEEFGAGKVLEELDGRSHVY
ncbi:MAG: DNA/RNA helicase domain-containing protein, partial [Gemmataceae bacterium]